MRVVVFVLFVFYSVSIASERFNYNKAESRDVRIGQKIDEIFGAENIRIWFYDREKLVNSEYMFEDEKNEYYQLRVSTINKIKSSNIDLKLLDISDSKKIFGKGYEKLIISNEDENLLKSKGIRYLFLIHDYFCEEDSSGIPEAYKGVAIAVSALVGNPLALLSSISSDQDYFISGVTLSIYDLSDKSRIIFRQELIPAYSFADDNYDDIIKRIFDFLYDELQADKYKKPREKTISKTVNKEKSNTNLFENPRNRRREMVGQ